MTIGERIKEIRVSQGLNQGEFAEAIGLKRSAISAMETSLRGTTPQTIQSICRMYGVNEEWLRNGTGPMYLELEPTQKIEKWLGSIQDGGSLSRFKAQLVAALAELDDAGWRAVHDVVMKAAAGELFPREEPEPEDEDARIEAEADMVRASYIQTRKGAAASSASSGGDADTG